MLTLKAITAFSEKDGAMAQEQDQWGQGGGHFCANESCQLHVTASDAGVNGWGHWAVVDGVMYDRHSVEIGGPLFCSDCRKAMADERTAAARAA